MKKDWWKTFFGRETGAMMFDKARHARSAAEVEHVVRQAKPRRRAVVLDLACGPGRHVMELAKRGYSVTGIDYSAEYVAQAQAALKRSELEGKVIRGDMRHLQKYFGKGVFDLVVCLYNSFGYFNDRADDRHVLSEVAAVLKSGGAFVLNTLNRPGVEYRLRELAARSNLDGFYRWEQRGTKRYFLDRARYDKATRRTHAEWIFIDAERGRVKRLEFGQNAYSYDELRRLLRRVNLRVEKVWGRLAGGPFSKQEWHQTIVARRR